MNDPRNHALAAVYPHKQEVPEHGTLLELATRQAADHKMRVTDRQIAAFLRESDDSVAWLTESISDASISTDYQTGVREVDARANLIIDALESGDDCELGRIFRAAVWLYLMPVIARGEA